MRKNIVETSERLWTPNFTLLCCSNFFQFMTHYLLMATLPLFIMDILKSDTQQVGYAMSAYFISTILCRPLLGKWLDEFDKRKVLMMACVLFIMPCLLYFRVSSIFSLQVLRFIHGLGFGAITTATAALAADIAPENRKGEGISYFAMFMTLGTVLGPLTGLTLITNYNFTVLFTGATVTGFCGFLCAYLIRLNQFTENPPTLSVHKKLHWKQFFEPHAMPIGLIAGFTSLAYSGISTFLSLYAQEQNLLIYAGYFFLVYAIVVLLTRPWVGRVFDQLGANIVIYPAIFIFAIGLVVLSQIHSATGFFASGALIGLGNGTLFSCLQALAIKVSPAENRGVATSTYFMLFDIGNSLGCSILAKVALNFGYSTMYLFGSMVVVFSAFLYYLFQARSRHSYPETE